MSLDNAAWADDGIRSYIVPKEIAENSAAPAVSAMAPGMAGADIPVNNSKVTWTTPVTWQEIAPTSIRIGNFVVHGDGQAQAEMGIFSFPGNVGTELGNINRWRAELNLSAISSAQIVSSPVTVDGAAGKLYEIPAATNMTLAASVPRDGATWFFKMRGNKDVVTDAEPVFRDFLKTVRFHDGGTDAAAPVAPAVPALSDFAPTTPIWTVPADWKENAPGSMVFKSFSMANGGGQTANVSVSVFPDQVGGTFANVNRWRGQMSLPPLAESDLPGVTQSFAVDGGQGTLVDFPGTMVRSGKSGRLVAIIVPSKAGVWFYKLMGEDAVVEAERTAFLHFVQTARYP